MPKAESVKREKIAKAEKMTGKEAAYLMLPWSCKPYPDRTEIEAYIPGRDWETIAEVMANPGVDAELIARFIVRVVNGHEQKSELIEQMAYALELCLACEGITWEAEQEASAILNRSRQSPIL